MYLESIQANGSVATQEFVRGQQIQQHIRVISTVNEVRILPVIYHLLIEWRTHRCVVGHSLRHQSYLRCEALHHLVEGLTVRRGICRPGYEVACGAPPAG